VALIGLGQIGASIGLALGARGGWRRVGHDAGALDEVADTLEAACAGAELAVLAIPVGDLPAAIDRAARALPAGATPVDTGSARAAVTPALERAAALGIRALGAHPLAGNEHRGLAGADARMFQDAAVALVPVGGGIPEVVRALVRDLGAREIEVSAAGHDRALARTSHLPYLVACGLRSLGGEAARAGLGGPGFRDMTRLAASDPGVAGAYCRANAGEIATAWRELRAALDRAVADLGRRG
jgi:prephenate dehydrogenase